MGRQVNFFLDDDDLRTLETHLIERHDLVFFEWDARRGNNAVAVCRPTARGSHGKPLFAVGAAKIERGHLVPGGAFVEVNAGGRRGDRRLARGRIHFFTSPATAPDEVRWAARVMGAVRRSLVRVPQYRPYLLGAAAARWAETYQSRLTGDGQYLERP